MALWSRIAVRSRPMAATVVMKAATARNTARQAINMDGLVEANTVSGSNGAITFGGGAGGAVKVSGTV